MTPGLGAAGAGAGARRSLPAALLFAVTLTPSCSALNQEHRPTEAAGDTLAASPRVHFGPMAGGISSIATTDGLDIFDRRSGKVVQRFPLPARTAAERPHSEVSLCEDHSGTVWIAFSSISWRSRGSSRLADAP